MTALILLKLLLVLAFVVGAFRDRIDWRPTLELGGFSRALLLLMAALPMGLLFLKPGPPAIIFLIQALVLGAVALLPHYYLTPEGIEPAMGGKNRNRIRWDEVVAIGRNQMGITVVDRNAKTIVLPRSMDGLATFARIARVAVPHHVLTPQAERVLNELERRPRVR